MILITGSTGQSGRAIVSEFARHGVTVRALVRDGSKAEMLRALPGVEVVEGDMAHPDTLLGVLGDVDQVVLISTAGASMLEAQCTFIDAAKAAGVGHIVKFSGAESGIGFRAVNFRYTRLHEQIERYLEASGLAWTHLRPSQFMQVYLREAPSIAKTGTLSLPAGGIELSPVDIEDIAKVAFRVLTTDGHHGKSFEMTGPDSLTMTQIAAAISKATGKSVRYVSVTPEQKRQELLNAGTPPEIADALYGQALERLEHPQSRVSLQTHELFDVRPTTFPEFLQRYQGLF